MPGGGEIFVLNMGEPVKILGLATDTLIGNCPGYRAGRRISESNSPDIRPGEEIVRGTSHE